MRLNIGLKLNIISIGLVVLPLLIIGALSLWSLVLFNNRAVRMTDENLSANAENILLTGARRDRDEIAGFIRMAESDTVKMANSGTLVSYLETLAGESEAYNRMTRDLCNEMLRGYVDAANIQNAASELTLKASMSLAKRIMDGMGAFGEAELTPVEWNAVNQFTHAQVAVKLPAVKLGETIIPQNFDASNPTPLTDEIVKNTGGAATLFQRMNDAGDMLRVATSVIGTNGRRAVGTFIPAINSDGTSNQVIATVLNGESFVGRAFVVKEWYLTEYRPIKDAQGKVRGVLFVGLPEQGGALVRSLMAAKIGETG